LPVLQAVFVPNVPAAAILTEVIAAFAAGAETTENVPAARAETAISAMRLRNVFVDICFLSLVRLGIS
jgi:hypothetical protein